MFGATQMIKMIAILAIVGIVAGGLWYITNLKANLAISQINEQVLKDSVKQQNDLINSIKEDIAQIQVINKTLTEQASKHAQEVKDLTDKFNVNAKGEARDFGAIAAAKPALIERLVNRGTDSAIRCLEIATGSPLTDKERNAKTSSEINRECPSIANPNYIPVTP
jgi:hypothetical protein|tara:strand:+ start:11281 stop:11778 length:498 start_codon:yes stop_codon:yes gene_type:complete